MKKAMFIMLIAAFVLATIMPVLAAGKSWVGQSPPEINALGWINTSKVLKLSDLKGKVVVVEFWATWCPPCRASIPHLIKLYNQYRNKDVVFISLTNESGPAVQKFIKDNKMNYPIGLASKSAQAYGVQGIPHAMVIGKDGKVVWEGHPMSGLDKALQNAAK